MVFTMIVSYGQYMEYGVLANSVQVFLRFMGLSHRKTIRAADTIGRTNLQASYTLWLLRNMEKKVSRGTLVERSQSPAISAATDHSNSKAPGISLEVKSSELEGPRGTRSECPAKQVPSSASTSRCSETGVRQGAPHRGSQMPPGLTSLGKTCFINSVTQCLLVTDGIASLAPPEVRKALAGLRFAGGQTVCPTDLIRAISQLSPSLTSGQQQDAAEALEVMLTPNPIQEPFSAQILGEVADVITCVACNSESVMKRPLSPSILWVPIMAQSPERRLTYLMTPQPIDGRRCSQCSNVSSEIATQILATPQAMPI